MFYKETWKEEERNKTNSIDHSSSPRSRVRFEGSRAIELPVISLGI